MTPSATPSRRSAKHAIRCAKVVTDEGDELPVGRVVDRLDPNNLRFESMIVLVHVLDELELGFPRADYENLACALERLGDLVVEVLVICRVIPLGGLGWVAADMLPRMNHLRFDCLGINMENPGFVVIDPDSGV
jgi:hypothetical protein